MHITHVRAHPNLIQPYARQAGLSLTSIPTTTSDFAKRFRRSSRGRSCLAAVERVASAIAADTGEGDGHRVEWRENERMKVSVCLCVCVCKCAWHGARLTCS